MSEEIKTILEEIRFKAGIYRDQEKRNEAFKDENYKCNLLLNYIQEKEDMIKEIKNILKKYISNPSGTKDGWHIDCWNNKDILKLNSILNILDKENK